MTTLLIESKTGPPAADAEERDYISYSAIRAYLQCSLRYYFRYIAKLPEERIGASLVFGNTIHGALELHFRRLLEGDVAPSLTEMLAAYQAGWANPSAPIRFSKDEQQHSFDGLAERMMRAFLENPVAQPKGQILGVEETLREPLIPGLPDFLGRIDLIVETDEAIVITDWKTSRSRYSAEQFDEAAAQLLLYAELACEIAAVKPLRLQFGVLTKTKEVSIDTHSVDYESASIERTKRIIARVWQAIQAEHFYPNPSAMNCSGCPYRSACRRWSGWPAFPFHSSKELLWPCYFLRSCLCLVSSRSPKDVRRCVRERTSVQAATFPFQAGDSAYGMGNRFGRKLGGYVIREHRRYRLPRQ